MYPGRNRGLCAQRLNGKKQGVFACAKERCAGAKIFPQRPSFFRICELRRAVSVRPGALASGDARSRKRRMRARPGENPSADARCCDARGVARYTARARLRSRASALRSERFAASRAVALTVRRQRRAARRSPQHRARPRGANGQGALRRPVAVVARAATAGRTTRSDPAQSGCGGAVQCSTANSIRRLRALPVSLALSAIGRSWP